MVESREQMEILGLRAGIGQVAFDLDYARERLVVISVLLSSSSIRLSAPAVYLSDDGYSLTWEGDAPRIGNARPMVVRLWAVVPADGSSIVAPHNRAGSVCSTCTAGLVNRAGIVYRSPGLVE